MEWKWIKAWVLDLVAMSFTAPNCNSSHPPGTLSSVKCGGVRAEKREMGVGSKEDAVKKLRVEERGKRKLATWHEGKIDEQHLLNINRETKRKKDEKKEKGIYMKMHKQKYRKMNNAKINKTFL